MSALEILGDVAEFLEDYSDVIDGDDGAPAPNKAMSLLGEVEREIERLKARPEAARIEPFIVKHYGDDERPIIKGNGFDGLQVGMDREEAEDFIKWINERLAAAPSVSPEEKK